MSPSKLLIAGAFIACQNVNVVLLKDGSGNPKSGVSLGVTLGLVYYFVCFCFLRYNLYDERKYRASSKLADLT